MRSSGTESRSISPNSRRMEEEVKSLNASLERRVAERTAEVESMLANATVGLAFADRELRCIRINQYLADIDGLPIEEHLGQKFHDLVPQIADLSNPISSRSSRQGSQSPAERSLSRGPRDPLKTGTWSWVTSLCSAPMVRCYPSGLR